MQDDATRHHLIGPLDAVANDLSEADVRDVDLLATYWLSSFKRASPLTSVYIFFIIIELVRQKEKTLTRQQRHTQRRALVRPVFVHLKSLTLSNLQRCNMNSVLCLIGWHNHTDCFRWYSVGGARRSYRRRVV